MDNALKIDDWINFLAIINLAFMFISSLSIIESKNVSRKSPFIAQALCIFGGLYLKKIFLDITSITGVAFVLADMKKTILLYNRYNIWVLISLLCVGILLNILQKNK